MKLSSLSARLVPVAAGLLLSAGSASAQLIRVGPGDFTAAATTITFSEFARGTNNPVYSFTGLAGLGNMSVSFAGAFTGQTVTGFGVGTLSGNPTGPLSLNTSVNASIRGDGSNPTSPVLSGTPMFNGPVVMLFSTPVGFVALDGGFFDALNGTSITGYSANGAALGSFTNQSLGIETYGFATADGSNSISGLAFYITGNEPGGFAIDNVRFGTANELVNPPNSVPEPASFSLLFAGAAGMMALRRRRMSR